jgi:rubrerythrin
MKDLDILKKVAELELASEERYAEQVSRICDREVKELLAELKEEKRRHKQECAVLMKYFDPKLDISDFNKGVDMELNTLLCANMPDLISYLEADIAAELDSKKEYAELIKNLKDEKLANIIKNFISDIDQHLEKIHTSLNGLRGEE